LPQRHGASRCLWVDHWSGEIELSNPRTCRRSTTERGADAFDDARSNMLCPACALRIIKRRNDECSLMPFRKTRCGKPNQSVLVRERQLDFHDVAAIEPIDKARYSTLRNPDRP
jgi:hypothetical protein